MENKITLSQKKMLRESYRRGIVRELYTGRIISQMQFRKLIKEGDMCDTQSCGICEGFNR